MIRAAAWTLLALSITTGIVGVSLASGADPAVSMPVVLAANLGMIVLVVAKAARP